MGPTDRSQRGGRWGGLEEGSQRTYMACTNNVVKAEVGGGRTGMGGICNTVDKF